MDDVQYVVKIREDRVLEKQLMKHYVWISRKKAQEVVNGYHGDLVSGCSFQFIKGKISSIEIIADSEQDAIDCVLHIFKLDRKSDKDYLPKF